MKLRNGAVAVDESGRIWVHHWSIWVLIGHHR